MIETSTIQSLLVKRNHETILSSPHPRIIVLTNLFILHPLTSPLKKKKECPASNREIEQPTTQPDHSPLFVSRERKQGGEEEHVIEQSVTSSSSTIPGGAVEPACNENKPVLARVLTLDPVSLRSTKLKTFRYQPRAERVYIVAGGPGNPQCGDIRAGPA